MCLCHVVVDGLWCVAGCVGHRVCGLCAGVVGFVSSGVISRSVCVGRCSGSGCGLVAVSVAPAPASPGGGWTSGGASGGALFSDVCGCVVGSCIGGTVHIVAGIVLSVTVFAVAAASAGACGDAVEVACPLSTGVWMLLGTCEAHCCG